ncbi:MAG: adenylate/guanylate cyclase domain-containing protein [Candidatus Eremiobacteraeota bacterium]|nr:adenylate/guanylate cyclase domain-containing protein [Candidatus Eremiobacteraeota bacterium]
MAAVAVVVAIRGARRVVAAQRETVRIRSVFSRYIAPHVLEELIERHDPRVLSGKAGYATILVARIWNFALFAEQLPQNDVLRYLNEFYTLAGRTIQKNRGMVDKFLGDGISGAFGFPVEDPLQEEHAIRAAIDIVRLVDGMNLQWASQGRRPLRVGIALNSGNVIAGEVGFLSRREYTVVGLPAIIASHLQERTEPMGAYILVTEATLEPVKHLFTTISAGTIPLRGMKRNARGYVVRGLAKNVSEEENLLLPPPSAFARTRVEDAAEGRSTWDSSVAAMPERDPDAPKPEPPKSIPKPASKPVAQPPKRPAPAPPRRRFDIPEVKGFGALDDSPALPDPPVAEGYYEDDSGRPPLKLPP